MNNSPSVKPSVESSGKRPAKNPMLSAKLVIGGTTVLALCGIVAQRCMSLVCDFHEDKTAYSVTSKPETPEAEGFAGPDTGSEAVDTDVDKEDGSASSNEFANKQLLDKELWGHMNALTNALARRYPFLPDPDLPDGRYSEELLKKIGNRLYIRRIASDYGAQFLEFYGKDEKYGYLPRLASLRFWRGGRDEGLVFSIDLQGDSSIISTVPAPSIASEKGVNMAQEYADVFDRYAQDFGRLRSAQHEFWDRDGGSYEERLTHFQRRSGFASPEENSSNCRLLHRYRAEFIELFNRHASPEDGELYPEVAERDAENGMCR